MARVSGFYEIDPAKWYADWVRQFDTADPDEAKQATNYEAFCVWMEQELQSEYPEINDVEDPDDPELDWGEFPIHDDQFIEAIWDELIIKPVRISKGQTSLFEFIDLSTK